MGERTAVNNMFWVAHSQAHSLGEKAQSERPRHILPMNRDYNVSREGVKTVHIQLETDSLLINGIWESTGNCHCGNQHNSRIQEISESMYKC